MRVYLCGPINGRSDDECKTWREQAKALLPFTLDPMRRDYRGREAEAVKEIIEMDKIDIAQSDALLVYFDQPSIGTAMEVLWAFERGKLIAVVNARSKPLSPWLIYHSHRVFTDISTACNWLAPQPEREVM